MKCSKRKLYALLTQLATGALLSVYTADTWLENVDKFWTLIGKPKEFVFEFRCIYFSELR